MLLFFVLPCVGFIGWASWNLIGGLLKGKPQDIPSRIEAVQKARSSGDRWQAVYALSQELQKMKIRGEWDFQVSPEQKRALFSSLAEMQTQHATDLRFKKYVLLTLGQFGSAEVVPLIRKELDVPASDPEIHFYAAWAYLSLLSKDPSARTPEELQRVRAWIQDKDPAFRKIAATFLVQYDKEKSLSSVKELLKDSNLEVKWNAAVALSSVGVEEAADILKEIFDLQKIRTLDLRSLEDLKQLLASGYEAARKLDKKDVLEAAQSLKSKVNPDTPEGRAIYEALK